MLIFSTSERGDNLIDRVPENCFELYSKAIAGTTRRITRCDAGVAHRLLRRIAEHNQCKVGREFDTDDITSALRPILQRADGDHTTDHDAYLDSVWAAIEKGINQLSEGDHSGASRRSRSTSRWAPRSRSPPSGPAAT